MPDMAVLHAWQSNTTCLAGRYHMLARAVPHAWQGGTTCLAGRYLMLARAVPHACHGSTTCLAGHTRCLPDQHSMLAGPVRHPWQASTICLEGRYHMLGRAVPLGDVEERVSRKGLRPRGVEAHAALAAEVTRRTRPYVADLLGAACGTCRGVHLADPAEVQLEIAHESDRAAR